MNLNNKLFLGDAGVNIISFITAINIVTIYSQENSGLTQEKVFFIFIITWFRSNKISYRENF